MIASFYSCFDSELEHPVSFSSCVFFCFGLAFSSAAATSPRLASPGSSAQVTINSNDDAFGVVQFASTSLTVTEPATPPVITVLRQAGSFGDVSSTISAVTHALLLL